MLTHENTPRPLTFLMISPVPRFPWRALIAVLAVALVGRALLLASGSVSFHSDEAVVALMARHINQGERPVFFYGQAYMGSLDPWLVAIGFRLLGESVQAIRVVQSALYLLVVASGFIAAWRLSGRPVVALVAGLTLAVPPVLMAVYSTATLGGYNETLLFGNLLLILAYDLTHETPRSLWRWALLGLIAGLGWWTNGLIVAFAAPVALFLLYRLIRPLNPARSGTLLQRGLLVGVAVALFFVGSAPWWVFNLQHDWAALAFYVARGDTPGYAGNGVPQGSYQGLGFGLFSLFVLGLPTVIGMRFPWEPAFFAPVIGAALVVVDLVALIRLLRRGRQALKPDARALILGMIAIFILIFLVSKFSIDPTGRYFLPLLLPFGIVLGTLVDGLRPRRLLQIAVVALVVGYYAAGQISAARVQPGLTTQFNLETHIPNDDDQALIDWLDAHHLSTGYTSYWIAFRIAFLSQERIRFSSALPYKSSLQYTAADERYPAYKQVADSSDDIAYITASVEAVRVALEAAFAHSGARYDSAIVGPYHIYYHFRPQIPRPPLELALPSAHK